MIAIKLALVTKRLNIDLASQKPIPLVFVAYTFSHALLSVEQGLTPPMTLFDSCNVPTMPWK